MAGFIPPIISGLSIIRQQENERIQQKESLQRIIDAITRSYQYPPTISIKPTYEDLNNRIWGR